MSSIVEEALIAKFDRLPEGVAAVLKGNPSFVDEDGPMRNKIFTAAPMTKRELLRGSQASRQASAIEVTGMLVLKNVCFSLNLRYLKNRLPAAAPDKQRSLPKVSSGHGN